MKLLLLLLLPFAAFMGEKKVVTNGIKPTKPYKI